jgi:hypothetical protein
MPSLLARPICQRVGREGLTYRSLSIMEKEFIDRTKAIREGILQLRDSL